MLPDDVGMFSPGDRVMAVVGHGGWATEVVAPAAMTFRAPEELTDNEVAAFPLAYGTAIHALVDRAALQAGERLLVTGASGGVGMAAIQVGRQLGARVVAIVSSEEKRSLATALGADEVIVADGELRPRLREMSPDGFDVVFDPVGGDQFEVLARSLAWRGRLLVVGFASGSIPAIPANIALLKGASVVGVFWGASPPASPTTTGALRPPLRMGACQRVAPPRLDGRSSGEWGRCPKRHGGAAPLGQGGTPGFAEITSRAGRAERRRLQRPPGRNAPAIPPTRGR